jgi:predicted PurR-regulated permease PerM|tara:strand:- start:91 stop:1158 length:1068 start_codon:yes stop_codon:yes gene_type:complete
MDSELYRKIIFSMIFLVLILVSFLIIKPFLTAVLTGIIFSYIFYPLYLRIYKKITNKNAASLITSVLVILMITLTLYFMLNTVSKEAYTTYQLSRQKVVSGQFISECQPADKPGCKTMNYFADKANDPRVKYYFDTTVKGVTTKITESISNILFSIPIFLLDMFIILFVMFFLFRDGEIFVDKVERIMPLKGKYREHVFKKLNDMAYAVIYGSIIIAIIQGTLAGLGFFILGLPSPLLWGAVMIFASLIPYVGSSIVWFPASLMLIFEGYLNFETTLIVKGILLILYGIFVIGTIDNILKPKIIGSKGGLHPVLVLLGVVGGLKFFGFVGVIIGPIILAMLVTFINIYEEEKQAE